MNQSGRQLAYAIFINVTCCLVSSWCVLYNKYLLTAPTQPANLDGSAQKPQAIFPHSISLLFVQNFFALVVLSAMMYLPRGWFWLRHRHRKSMTCLAPPAAIHVDFYSPLDWLCSLFFIVNVTAGLSCLAYLSVPM